MSEIIKATKDDNFLLDVLRISGKEINDISYVNGKSIDYRIMDDEEKSYFFFDNDVKLFIEKAKEFNYKSGGGGDVLNYGLEIVFNDGSGIETAEYDGTNGLEYKKTPGREEM